MKTTKLRTFKNPKYIFQTVCISEKIVERTVDVYKHGRLRKRKKEEKKKEKGRKRKKKERVIFPTKTGQ